MSTMIGPDQDRLLKGGERAAGSPRPRADIAEIVPALEIVGPRPRRRLIGGGGRARAGRPAWCAQPASRSRWASPWPSATSAASSSAPVSASAVARLVRVCQIPRRDGERAAEMGDGAGRVAGLRGEHAGKGDQRRARPAARAAPCRPRRRAPARSPRRSRSSAGTRLAAVAGSLRSAAGRAGDVEGDGQPLAGREWPRAVPHGGREEDEPAGLRLDEADRRQSRGRARSPRRARASRHGLARPSRPPGRAT